MTDIFVKNVSDDEWDMIEDIMPLVVLPNSDSVGVKGESVYLH